MIVIIGVVNIRGQAESKRKSEYLRGLSYPIDRTQLLSLFRILRSELRTKIFPQGYKKKGPQSVASSSAVGKTDFMKTGDRNHDNGGPKETFRKIVRWKITVVKMKKPLVADWRVFLQLFNESFLFMCMIDHSCAKNGVQVSTIKDVFMVLWKQKFQYYK